MRLDGVFGEELEGLAGAGDEALADDGDEDVGIPVANPLENRLEKP